MEICDLAFAVFNKCFSKSCDGCPFEGVPCCKKLASLLFFVIIKYPNVLEDFYNEME